MKVPMKIDGKESYFDSDLQKFFIEEKELDLNTLDEEKVAHLNKVVRDMYKKSKRLMLNVGCGYRPMQDMINLDYNPKCHPDVLRNLDEGLPFDDNKFDEVYSSHVIEHVKDVFFFMYEIWRVSKNKSKVTIICPYAGFLENAIQPDHLRLINYGFFERWRPTHHSVQDELKQTRGAYFNIKSKEIFNEGRELMFELEVVK